MTNHPEASKLALFAGGDLAWWNRWRVERHVDSCGQCQREVDAYRRVDEAVRELGSLPEDLNWDGLALEMKANIRLGLAAGECVDLEPRAVDRFGWKPALAMASLALVIMSGWLLQLPRPRIENAMNGAAARDQRVVLHSTSDGIELQQGKDRAFTVLYRAKEPALLSVNTDGSVQARYVDSYTGQVTITNVYTE